MARINRKRLGYIQQNMGHKMIKFVCAACGEDDVTADAYASWDVTTQSWVVESIYDKGAYCAACGGETRLESVEIEIGNLSRHSPGYG